MKHPTLIAATLLAIFVAQIAAAQTEPWKDQGESDIGLAAENEKDPAKQLDLLKKWEQQYPESALKGHRTLMTAQALIGIMGAAYGKTDPATLTAGQKAGQQLENNFKDYFDDSVKPPNATPEQWNSARKSTETQVHMVLAYIAGAQKNDAGAEAELARLLGVDPDQAIASYQLGATILHEMAVSKDPGRYSEALYDLARSLAVTGPTALTDTPQAKTRAAADSALKKNYGNYHGSAEGLDDLIKQAANSALPPPGFHIKSVIDIANEKAKNLAEWEKANPELAFWENIRTALQSQGDTFFANLQGVGFPPPPSDTYKGGTMFKGTVVSVPSPKQLLVNVDNIAGDAILKFDDNIKGDIAAGTSIQFKGVVAAYIKEPYVLTLEIQEPKTDIIGLPDGVTFVHDAAGKPKPTTRAPVKGPVKAAPKK